jgi:hypothetical protein
MVLLGISASYYWGHMLIADSLAGFFLSYVFSFFLFQNLLSIKITTRDIIFISLFTSLALLTALTYIYLCLFIYLYVLVLIFSTHKGLGKSNIVFKTMLICGTPYILFLLYLLFTGSFSNYLYQSVIFNQKYYIYFQGVSGAPKNPIRQIIIIAYNFYQNFFTLLVQAKELNFSSPFNITLAITNVTLLIYLFLQKRYKLLLFILLFITYANARSNPLDSRETDYQSAVYITATLFSMCYVLYLLTKSLSSHLDEVRKSVYLLLFLLTGTYCFFTTGFLLSKFASKAYTKYMGMAPLIYDTSSIAPLINTLASKDDYAWIGPLNFDDLYYMQAKLPSKYHILIPGMGKSAVIQQDMLSEFSKNKPKVMYFDKNFFILGSSPNQFAQFFISFVSANYITLGTYNSNEVKYTQINSSTNVDIINNLYINKDTVPEVINLLEKNNYIKEEQVQKPQLVTVARRPLTTHY